MVRDYSAYSLSELKEALANVHGEKFPEVKAALDDELRSRKETGRYEEELKEQDEDNEAKRTSNQKLANVWTKAIAGYMILAGPLVGFNHSAEGAGIATWALAGLAYLDAVSSIAIGVALLFDRLWAYSAALGFHALQLVRLHSDIFTWDVLSYTGIYAIYGEGGDIGINVVASPQFDIIIGRDSEFLLGLNVLTIAIVSCLFVARDSRTRMAHAA